MEELHDCGPIEPRSGSVRGGIVSSRSDGDRRVTRITIVARSRRDRGENRGHFEAKLKQNRGLVKANPEATSSPSKTAPTTLQIRPHDRFNCPRNRANFLFKNQCISLLFLNFLSIREGIKQISRKISSSS